MSSAMRYLFYLTIVSVLIAVLFTGGGFITAKFETVSNISSLFDYIFGDSYLKARVAELQKVNEDLRSQLLIQKITDAKTIRVYSVYPADNAKVIAIAAGADKDIKEGDIITYGKNILVGKVTQVFSGYSVVTTIFDPNWKMGVRVGEGQSDALFTGGNNSVLSLLSKDAVINTGDIVFTADQGYPYGLEVGKIKEINEPAGSPVKTAVLESVIDLKSLRNVQVYPTNFSAR